MEPHRAGVEAPDDESQLGARPSLSNRVVLARPRLGLTQFPYRGLNMIHSCDSVATPFAASVLQVYICVLQCLTRRHYRRRDVGLLR